LGAASAISCTALFALGGGAIPDRAMAVIKKIEKEAT
jgi:hypothetical protein